MKSKRVPEYLSTSVPEKRQEPGRYAVSLAVQSETQVLRHSGARAVAAAVLGLLLAAPVLGAGSSRVPAAKAPPEPSYTIPNIAAFGMSLTVLAIACKRYPRV
jgi:hypothetical protein